MRAAGAHVWQNAFAPTHPFVFRAMHGTLPSQLTAGSGAIAGHVFQADASAEFASPASANEDGVSGLSSPVSDSPRPSGSSLASGWVSPPDASLAPPSEEPSSSPTSGARSDSSPSTASVRVPVSRFPASLGVDESFEPPLSTAVRSPAASSRRPSSTLTLPSMVRFASWSEKLRSGGLHADATKVPPNTIATGAESRTKELRIKRVDTSPRFENRRKLLST